MDKVCYATGLTSASEAYAEYERVVAENLLTYSTFRISVRGSTLTLQKFGDEILASYPNEGSTAERKAVAYFTLVGGFSLTLFTADVALSLLCTAKNITEALDRRHRKGLSSERAVHAALDQIEEVKLLGMIATASPTDKVFLTALSVYLGKATGLSELGPNLVVPLVKVTLEKRKQDGAKSWPPIIQSFNSTYAAVRDDLVDDAFNLRGKALRPYVLETMAYIDSLVRAKLTGYFMDGYVTGLLIRSRPKVLTYDSRVAWFTNVSTVVGAFLHKHFGRAVPVSVTTARPFVPLETTDQLHESNSYFSRVALVHGTTKQPTMVPELMMAAIDAVLDENLSVVQSISEAACIILLYYSVYGTNAVRINRRPRVFAVVLRGKPELVKLSLVEEVLSQRSKSLQMNCFRVLARGYASLTFTLRMKHSIYRNNWRTLGDIDGRLAFDTVNFVPKALIPGYLVEDYYKAVAFIKSNEKRIQGELQ